LKKEKIILKLIREKKQKKLSRFSVCFNFSNLET